jgi:hypothetical protein
LKYFFAVLMPRTLEIDLKTMAIVLGSHGGLTGNTLHPSYFWLYNTLKSKVRALFSYGRGNGLTQYSRMGTGAAYTEY